MAGALGQSFRNRRPVTTTVTTQAAPVAGTVITTSAMVCDNVGVGMSSTHPVYSIKDDGMSLISVAGIVCTPLSRIQY